MSSIGYRGLLFKVGQELTDSNEINQILIVAQTAKLIGEDSESCHARFRPGDDGAELLRKLFEDMEKQGSLGIDNLGALRSLLTEVKAWSLIKKVDKFDRQRKDYTSLLDKIICKLNSLECLNDLISSCADHIPEEVKGDIKDVRKLFCELEKKNLLGVDCLALLKKILEEKGEQDLLGDVLKFEDECRREENFERRKAQAIAVISGLNRAAGSLAGGLKRGADSLAGGLNRAAGSLAGGVKLVCTFKTVAGVVLVGSTVHVLSKCTTLTEFFQAFTKVVLPTAIILREMSEGSLCFTVQAEMASALDELWNLYKDGTLKNRLQEFLVTKEVKEFAGSDEVEVTVFIDEYEWKEAYVNMMFHQNQADAVKEEQVGERRRRNSDSFLFLKSKESNMTKMKLEQSENKWNFERQLLQQEVKKLQMLIKQTEEGDEVAPELPSQLEQELNLKNSKGTGKEVVTEPLYQAKPSSKISPPSISSKVDPFRTDPRNESWYFGGIDQRSAERILKDQNPGRFLVRYDSRGLERYVISWRDTDGYRHQEIERFPDGMFVLRGENLRFSSLEASVLHFITGSTNDMAMVPLLKGKEIPPYERFLATSTYIPHPRLHSSVETGNTHEIETLLSSGVDIDSRDRWDSTPLMLAAENGDENTFRFLIERGSDPTLKDSSGESVLHHAAHGGSNEIIQELLSRGLDIDSRDNTGDTPLMEAVRFGEENAVRLLIERGSDPTSRNNMEQSMLHLAAQNGRKEIIQELLSRGLDIDSRDRDGDTPVIRAAIYGNDDAITLLLEGGSDPKQKDAKGRSLLHWAADFGRDALIENLLSLGLDINSRDNYGDTPLMKAAYRGRENASSLLIERGSDPALTDNRGQSALHWAARGGSKVIIEKLLSLGLDINSKTNSGGTPLMLATKSGEAEAVNYLLSRGAK